ncbi:MAG: SMP-30/gluconolactonase/LRE family protein [Anaerolineales bacterium]
MRLIKRYPLMTVVLILALLVPVSAAFAKVVYPDVIPLPDGFQPEGIAAGYGRQFYTGSIAGAAILRGDLRTGELEIIADPQPDRAALGMSFDRRTGLLFVSGGPTGNAYVYDGQTGADAGVFPLTEPDAGFVNDAIVTNEAVYFTDSFQPQMYRVPLGSNGELPDPSEVETIPLGGDFPFIPGGFNANGIVASPDERWLVIVNSAAGQVYRVDPATGEGTLIELSGGTAANGDGLILRGSKLFVVQNFSNQVSVFAVNSKLTHGQLGAVLITPDFRIPTTAAIFGDVIYAVNARFDQIAPGEATPDDEFEVVRVPLH